MIMLNKTNNMSCFDRYTYLNLTKFAEIHFTNFYKRLILYLWLEL